MCKLKEVPRFTESPALLRCGSSVACTNLQYHGKEQVGNHHFDLPHKKSERPCFFSFFSAWPKCTWSGAMALPATILFSTIFDLQPIDMAPRGSVLHFWLNGNMFPMLNGLKNLGSGFPFQGQRNFDLTL